MIHNYNKIIAILFSFTLLFNSCLKAENPVETKFENSLSESYQRKEENELIQNITKIRFHLVLEQNIDSSKIYYVAPDEKIIKNEDEKHPTYYKVKKNADITGEDIADAKISYEEDGFPSLMICFNEKGKKALSEVTNYLSSQLAIVYDDKVLSAPRIQAKIEDGIIQCSGIIKNNEYMRQSMYTTYILAKSSNLSFHIIEKQAYSIKELGSVSKDEIVLRNPVYCSKTFYYKLKKENSINSSDILKANLVFDNKDYQVIKIEFNDNAKNAIADLTEKYKGKQLALVLDNIVYSSPNITSKITDGNLKFRIMK